MEEGRRGHLSARAQRFSPEGCVWPRRGLEAQERELASSPLVPTQKEFPTVPVSFRMSPVSLDNLAERSSFSLSVPLPLSASVFSSAK